MSRFVSIVGILGVGFTVMFSGVGFAADQAVQPAAASTDAAPAATTTPAAPAADQTSAAVPAVSAASAQTAPAPAAIPTLKPIVITFSGELAAVDVKATPATVTVQDRYGVRKEISLPAEAKISQSGAAKTATDLKVGDKLTVEYTYDVASGKRAAQVITIGESASSKAAAQ